MRLADAVSAIGLLRLAIVTMTAVVLALAAYEFVLQWELVAGTGKLGDDFAFYRGVGERWLATGELYQPRQLEGPYDNVVNFDVLYPPLALALFVPFAILPAILWWAIPLGILGVHLLLHRPRPWTWPVLALVVLWPRTIGGVLFGNTDMWVAAFVAAGTVLGWPAVGILIKPSFVPLLAVGARHRSFWFALGATVLLSALGLELWSDYVSAIGNVRELPLAYSLANLPLTIAPIVVWLGRSRSWGGRALGSLDVKTSSSQGWRAGGLSRPPWR